MAASSSSTARSAIVRSMWHMIVRERSAPSLRIISTMASGKRSWRPGWIMSAAPVSRCAATAARTTFFSLSVKGHVVPISPMKPALTPVPSTPTVRSATSSRVMSSWLRRPMSGGCAAST